MSVGPCPDWNRDLPADELRIIANIKQMWPVVEQEATSRPAPALATALGWHRRIYTGVTVPHPDYVGNVRDSDQRMPCLVDYEVGVAGAPALLARDVPDALDAFIGALDTVTSTLDRVIPAGLPPTDPPVMGAVIRLCAYAHGEWIRIHPFANGTGRTARIWANWLGARYHLPAFVRIKPRPDDLLFAGAARQSMSGDHRATEAMFAGMLADAILAARPGS